MSTENSTTAQLNGTSASAASSNTNGLKAPTLSSFSSSASSTRTTTNSSFLYSGNSLLGSAATAGIGASSRTEKITARQAPPPTLPKYTSSFNAGSNGTGSAIDRLAKEREAGAGSYRLSSLDRLAMRQRNFDGDASKTNGDANSVRKERSRALRVAQLI
ncbi:hypothetical protein TKK_0001210 [Trichogramma kaykai]